MLLEQICVLIFYVIIDITVILRGMVNTDNHFAYVTVSSLIFLKKRKSR